MPDAQRRTARLDDPDSDGVQALKVAEAQEAEAAGEYVAVPVAGMEIRVKPQADWRMSDLRNLNQGDLDAWAEAAIDPDDLDRFFEADITLAEFRAFTREAAARTGDGLGKSSRPSR
jgi:hypothetical protein